MRTAVRHKHPYTVPEVLRMQAEGRPHSQIGQHFGISRARVGQIIKAEKQRVLAIRRAESLRRQLRASHDLDDLDRKLPLADLFCLLELPSIIANRFTLYLHEEGATEMSLRQFMDVLLPPWVAPQNFYEVLPALKIRNIGKQSYADVIMRLSSLDLSEAFRKEWARRRRNLNDYLAASEGFHKSGSLLYQFCGANGKS
jgi:hypothetical protein